MAVITETKEKNPGKFIRNVMLFAIFVVIGIITGVYGTLKYNDYKNSKDKKDIPEMVEGPEDITNVEEFKEIIDSMIYTLNEDPIFYSSKGLVEKNMSNSDKLSHIYSIIEKEGKGTSEVLEQPCLDTFLPDDPTNFWNKSCSVKMINKSEFSSASNKYFNDEVLDMSVSFNPYGDIVCYPSEDVYYCGTVKEPTGVTGRLEPKFETIKVTKEDDGTINVYQKGYLVDRRSNVVDPESGNTNYYLHSSDSTDYYFELKSADNLTFKHCFVSNDRKNYYYVSTEVVEE